MFTNFSNLTVPDGAGEYSYDSYSGPIRATQSHSWRMNHQQHGGLPPQRGPGMAGPIPYERHYGRAMPYNGPDHGPYGFHRDRFVDQGPGPLDYFGSYPPLPLMRGTVDRPDFTPCAANTGPSGLEREIRERYLKPFTERPRLFLDFGAPDAAQPIAITFDISARRIDICWTPPDVPANVRYSYQIEIYESTGTIRGALPWHRTSYSIRAHPGASYDVHLQCKDVKTGRVLAQAYKQNVKAMFSMEEMEKMYERAVDTIGVSFQAFKFLYRCKPQAYWDDIVINSQGIMETYLKDNNGQPANPINGMISGLFFSARTAADGSLPTSSPFGNRRLIVQAPFLLNTLRHSMYFSDYYCNYTTHYVTIVICRKESHIDRYCASKLKRLNPETNPFLRVEYHPPSRQYPEGGTLFLVNRNVWVEIYYTENIPIYEGELDWILATGAGTSRIGGLPNNKHCEQCNLYPIREGTDSGDNVNKDLDSVEANNSTFSLINKLEPKLKPEVGADNWNDVVETVCEIVNGVCELEESEQDPGDFEQRSMERINNALAEMDKELESCEDIEVLAVSDDLRAMVDIFKQQRQQLANLIEDCMTSSRLLDNATTSSSTLPWHRISEAKVA